jgi:hypothetical protein
VPRYFLVTELNAWIAGKQIKTSEVCDPSLVHRAYTRLCKGDCPVSKKRTCDQAIGKAARRVASSEISDPHVLALREPHHRLYSIPAYPSTPTHIGPCLDWHKVRMLQYGPNRGEEKLLDEQEAA